MKMTLNITRTETNMNDTVIKLRLRQNAQEIEYEGPVKLLDSELFQSIEKLQSILPTSGLADGVSPQMPDAFQRDSNSPSLSEPPSTNFFAEKFEVSSGPELVIAAAAKLMVTDRLNSFTRQQLLTEMKSASLYYRQSYVNNLGSYIKTLVKRKKLNAITDSKFSLSASVLTVVRNKLHANSYTKDVSDVREGE